MSADGTRAGQRCAVLAFVAVPGFAHGNLTIPWATVWDTFVVNLTVRAAVSASACR